MSKYKSTHTGEQIDKYLDEAHELNVKEESMPPVINSQVSVDSSNVSIRQNMRDGSSVTLTIHAATTDKAGAMSASDKAKLDGAAAEEYVDALAEEVNGNKETELTHHSQSVTNIAASPYAGGVDIEVYKGGSQSPSHIDIPSATTSAAGVMSAADKAIINVIRQNYINAGATYNAATGYYSLNGLTDITEEQMAVIYADTYRKQCGKDLSYMFYGSSARTNFPARNRENWETGLTCIDLCYCRQMEVFKWGREYDGTSSDGYYGTISNSTEMFNGCVMLHTIIGVINISPVTSKPISMFSGCNALENVQILALKTSLDLQSPVISHDSLMFLVEHASNTSAITVKVHQDVWARINSTEWDDIYVAATAKNISFAY